MVQDEVLSQRLGLVPLRVDPHKVEFKLGSDFLPIFRTDIRIKLMGKVLFVAGDEPTDLNTIVFSLVVKCEILRNVQNEETDPERMYKNAHGGVYLSLSSSCAS